MKQNMGKMDRALRALVAAGAITGSGVLGFSTAWGIVLLVVAAVMLLTSATAYCPLYSLFGLRTTGARGAENDSVRRVSHLRRAA